MKVSLLDPSLPVSVLGEGPHWDHASRMIYWVDITGNTIHRYDPAKGTHDKCITPSMVGFAVLDSNGRITAGLRDGLYRFDFSGENVELLARPQDKHADNRFNDGKCDRRGRMWGGTMNHADHQNPTGSLYRLDAGGLHEQEMNIHISNGIGWSPDNKTMYYTDTVRRVIWRYDYDIATGIAAGRRIFAEFSGKGRPDGLCVDSQGRVFTALWPGWCVEIYAPDGKPDGKIDLPVPQVSSCAFGGSDLKTLYITTASIGLSEDSLKQAPLSGHVFTVEMDVPGLPETPFKG